MAIELAGKDVLSYPGLREWGVLRGRRGEELADGRLDGGRDFGSGCVREANVQHGPVLLESCHWLDLDTGTDFLLFLVLPTALSTTSRTSCRIISL